MEVLQFSFIIPVYNRPDEIRELLESFNSLHSEMEFEIVIVEDGSDVNCKDVIAEFSQGLNINYYYKPNSGPGDSRNFGMSKATGNYFIILDSDVILPKQYLNEVINALNEDFVDCFGGPDAAHPSFSSLQKAIDFTMTSFLTTGGIRGGKRQMQKFQPRSFNMGLSKNAFKASEGFGNIHPGEDPDLSIRLWKLGYRTKLISEAYVYHKRRISWLKFYQQVYKFGLVRPILNIWHPKTKSLVFWFPTIFSIGLIVAIICWIFGFKLPVICYANYFGLTFLLSLIKSKNLIVALLSLATILVQFLGYGFGFLKSTLALSLFNKTPEARFPQLFFKN